MSQARETLHKHLDIHGRSWSWAREIHVILETLKIILFTSSFPSSSAFHLPHPPRLLILLLSSPSPPPSHHLAIKVLLISFVALLLLLSFPSSSSQFTSPPCPRCSRGRRDGGRGEASKRPRGPRAVLSEAALDAAFDVRRRRSGL